MKRVLLLVISIMLLVVGCNSKTANNENDEKLVFGFSCANNANEANINTLVAMEKAIADSGLDIELVHLDARGLGENHISHVETFITRNVDAIIMQPIDAAAGQVAVETAIEADIPVFTIGAKISDNSICTFVGQDSKIAGEIEMQYIADLLNGEGKIAVIEGPPGNSDTILRTEGIKNIVSKYDGLEIIYSQPGHWLREEGMALTETWLQSGNDIAAVVGENDEMALGAYDAIVQAGLENEILVIGIDAISAAKESVSNGEMVATVLQDAVAIGTKAIEVAIAASNGEELLDVYEIKPVLLTKENISDYM